MYFKEGEKSQKAKVVFKEEEEARNAAAKYDGCLLDGRNLKITLAAAIKVLMKHQVGGGVHRRTPSPHLNPGTFAEREILTSSV